MIEFDWSTAIIIFLFAVILLLLVLMAIGKSVCKDLKFELKEYERVNNNMNNRIEKETKMSDRYDGTIYDGIFNDLHKRIEKLENPFKWTAKESPLVPPKPPDENFTTKNDFTYYANAYKRPLIHTAEEKKVCLEQLQQYADELARIDNNVREHKDKTCGLCKVFMDHANIEYENNTGSCARCPLGPKHMQCLGEGGYESSWMNFKDRAAIQERMEFLQDKFRDAGFKTKIKRTLTTSSFVYDGKGPSTVGRDVIELKAEAA